MYVYVKRKILRIMAITSHLGKIRLRSQLLTRVGGQDDAHVKVSTT